MIHIIALAVINAASASIFAIITLLVSISPTTFQALLQDSFLISITMLFKSSKSTAKRIPSLSA